MNNVFSAKRFGKYLSYDLKHATDVYGLSLLIVGLLPIINFFFAAIFCRIISGDWIFDFTVGRVVAVLMALAITMLVFPTKAYGDITDKRAGSTFLMVPASTLEKWLSCMLITLVILPAALFCLLAGSDLVMGLIFPKMYGTPAILQDWFRLVYTFPTELTQLPVDVTLNVGLVAWVSWATSILVFLLGAVYFKKNKIGLTILAIWAISMVLSLVMAPFAVHMPDLANLLENADPATIIRNFKIITWSIDGVEIAAFMAIIYARFRTIKQ